MNSFTTLFYLSIGIDGVQCFKEAEYSVTPIAIKLWNLHPEERTSRDFVFITALIPGPKKPKSYSPYLLAIVNEISMSVEGIKIQNRWANKPMTIKLKLKTCECDGGMAPSVSEAMGVATCFNCNRCRNPGTHNPRGNGSYQMGYLDGTAFIAARKTNDEMRAISMQVASNLTDPKDHGIRAPSIIALKIPGFDITYGWVFEYFHKLCLPQNFLEKARVLRLQGYTARNLGNE